MSNYDELTNGTDPLVSLDSDLDGLPDDWEKWHFGNLASGATGNPDNDGLSNLEEFAHGTNPKSPDSDFDGLSDGAEVNIHGTDPLKRDTDGDTLPDGWEVQYGLNPLDPADANQTAVGGGMTNLQHYELGSNPNNPPPPPTITAGTATIDQSAATLLYPADDSQLLLKNGNFSAPALSPLLWDTFGGITGWTALSGSLVELQQIEVNTTASAGQYCELDAHWPTVPHLGPSDHGIQQTVDLARGRYVLFFDYRGRNATARSFTVKARTGINLPGLPQPTEYLLATENAASTTAWKRASTTFEVTGGNPNLATLPITLIFDIADAADSYGAYIDNVLLLPVNFKARSPFSEGFDPPIAGDMDPQTGKRDEDDPVPWTSVTKSGSSQINTWVKITVPSATYAPLFSLHVADDSTDFISVQPSALTGADTNITITGKPGDDNIKEATIELRMVNTGQVACRLKVMVLPRRGPIDVSFYVARNSKSQADSFFDQPASELDTAYGYVMGQEKIDDPSDVVAEINERMKACGVDVVLGATGDKILPFDLDDNHVFLGRRELNELLNSLKTSAVGGSCVILYLPKLGSRGITYSKYGLICGSVNYYLTLPGNEVPAEDSSGTWDSMKRTLAHEFGHYLDISTRVFDYERHDNGPYPNGTIGLMRSGGPGNPGRWMRHEDWQKANNTAKERMQ